jgi:hypothetical protein
MLTNRNLVLAVATALPACILHGCKDDKPPPGPNPDPDNNKTNKELEDMINEWAKDDPDRIVDAAAAFEHLNEEGKNRVKFVNEDLFNKNPLDLHAYVFAHNMFSGSDKISAFDESCFDDEKFESFFQSYDEDKKKDLTIKRLPTAGAAGKIVGQTVIDYSVYLTNPLDYAQGDDDEKVFTQTLFMQVDSETPKEDAGFAHGFSGKKKSDDSSFIQARDVDTDKNSNAAAVNQMMWLLDESVPAKAYNNRVIALPTPYAESLDKLNMKSFFTSTYSSIDMINMIIQQQGFFTKAGQVMQDGAKPPVNTIPNAAANGQGNYPPLSSWGGQFQTDIKNKDGVKTGDRTVYRGGDKPDVVGRGVPAADVIKKQYDDVTKQIKAFVDNYRTNMQQDGMFDDGVYGGVCDGIYADATIADDDKRSKCCDKILEDPYQYNAVFRAAIALNEKNKNQLDKIITAMNLVFASRGLGWITANTDLVDAGTPEERFAFPQNNLFDYLKVWDSAQRNDLVETVWPAQADWNEIIKKDEEKKAEDKKFVDYVSFPEFNKHMNSNIISTVQVQQTTKKAEQLEGQVLGIGASLGDAIAHSKSNHFYLAMNREFDTDDQLKEAKKEKDYCPTLRQKRQWSMDKEQKIKHFANLKFNGDDAWKAAYDKVSSAIIAKAKSLDGKKK